jgi:glutathione S-transferase
MVNAPAVDYNPIYTLINATPSPYGRKAAIVMHEKGIAFEFRFDKPWEPTVCTHQ